MNRCPECGSIDVHRSKPRSLTEWIKKTLGMCRPYRCRTCGWRGLGPKSARSRPTPAWAGIEEHPDLAALDKSHGAGRSRRKQAGAEDPKPQTPPDQQ